MVKLRTFVLMSPILKWFSVFFTHAATMEESVSS